jgi:integrase
MLGSGRRHTIGSVAVVRLSHAREEARRLRAEKTLGLLKQPSAMTLGEALPLFLDDHYKARRPRTKKEAKRLLEKHFLPPFRRTNLADLTDADIGARLDKLAKTPGEQLHAFRMLRTFLRWCTRPPRRYIRHSPLEGYPAPSVEKKGTRTLTDEELVKVWRARDDAAGDFVRLLILWGSRNTETACIERSWIADGMLTIPGAVTKNHRAHSIPLLPMALEILERQPRGTKYFFPGRTADSHLCGWSALKESLDEKCGFDDWQLRDIRRTFRSNMARLRVPRDVCEILLNHVTGGGRTQLDEIYDRWDRTEPKREALAQWEAYLSQLLART